MVNINKKFKSLVNYINKNSFSHAQRITKDKLIELQAKLDQNLPQLSNIKLNIIGMTHAAPNMEKIRKNAAIESQIKIYQILQDLNPELIGMEGFQGYEYNPYNFVSQLVGREGNKTINSSQINQVAKSIINDPRQNAMFRYQLINKSVISVGIEEIILDITTNKIILHIEKYENNPTYYKYLLSTLSQTFKEIQQLRGLLMLANMYDYIKEFNSYNPVCIVGGDHVDNEINELIQNNSITKWVIYDT